MTERYTRDFAAVVAAEREMVEAQRRRRGVRSGERVGLALSGGGIRSAAFGMGVLQALDAGDAFRRIDYLSTVSGGGYIGTALTWFLRDGRLRFPFGRRTVGARSPGRGEREAIRDFIRLHGDYLDPRTGFDKASFDPHSVAPDPRALGRRGVSVLSLGAVVLKHMLLSGFVYGALFVTLFFFLNVLDAAVFPLKALLSVWVRKREITLLLAATNVALLFALFLFLVFVVAAGVYSTSTFFGHLRHTGPRGSRHAPARAYAMRLRFERALGNLWLAILIALAFGSVPLVSLLLAQWLGDGWTRGTLAGAVTGVGAVLGRLVLRRSPRRRTGTTPAKAAGRAGIAVGGFLLVYGFLLFSYTIAVGIADSRAVWSIWAVLGGGLFFGFFADLNALGSHRVYRDRLMEAFMPGHWAVFGNTWRPAVDATGATLHEMSGAASPGPYHILNATLLTLGSRDVANRGRGGDSFVLSPLFCGSDATGWRATRDWLDGSMTLATAMAISAAAANPYAAVSGRGATRGRFVSMLMTLLNLRLGYWTHNPDPDRSRRTSRIPPNFLHPGLFGDVFGMGLDERRPFIQLTDGGDFENLGLYELVRRETDVIIVSDATEDAARSFDSLANAVERVRVDFGVTITFPNTERGLSSLARRGYAIGRIAYPGARGEVGKEAMLVYLKATMVPDLPVDLLGYKAAHASFPDQPTSDQFFDESDFEAYRELGYQLASILVREEPALAALDTPALVESADRLEQTR
jgi:hypothetical protein